MTFLKTIAASAFVAYSAFSIADGLPSQPYISVAGQAQFQVKPDTVNISFQAMATENSAESAKQAVDQQVQSILSSLHENGFEESLLVRGDIRLRPEYEFIQQKQTQIGIRAVRNLSYQLDDLTKTNLFLAGLVEADIANIGQLNYSLQRPTEWQKEARDLAVKDAIEKAQSLADSFQVSLGKVYSIRYQSNTNPPIMMRNLASKTTPALYQTNQITISDRVDTIFLLGH